MLTTAHTEVKMNRQNAKEIFAAGEQLISESAGLIKAIDKIEDNQLRREFRKKYAEMIAKIEEDFFYDVCQMNRDFRDLLPDLD